MNYATFTPAGFELRIGGDVPVDALTLTDDEFDGLSSGVLTITNGSVLAASQPTNTVADQLAALEATNAMTQSDLRKAIMLLTTAIVDTNPGLDLTQIPGVAKVFEVEAQAEALRAQL